MAAYSLLDSIQSKAKQQLIPFSVLLELTRQCNLDCQHCYQVVDNNRLELSTTRILELIDELHEAGCLFLALTGGEPLCHLDFLKICARAHKAHLVIQISSNGTMLTQEMVRRLSRFNIFNISFSLYGARPQTHDSITRHAGSYERTIKSALMLKRHRLGVRFKFIMMQDNIDEYESMLDLARKLDIPYDLDPVITPCDNGHLAPTQRRLGNKDLEKIYRKHQQRPVNSINDLDCSFGRSHCAINAYGDVYPCIQLPVPAGNILDKSFKQIWQHSAWLKEVRDFSLNKIPACRECDLATYCRPCPGLAYVEEGSLYRPSREACRHARIIKSLNKKSRTLQPSQ